MDFLGRLFLHDLERRCVLLFCSLELLVLLGQLLLQLRLDVLDLRELPKVSQRVLDLYGN